MVLDTYVSPIRTVHLTIQFTPRLKSVIIYMIVYDLEDKTNTVLNSFTVHTNGTNPLHLFPYKYRLINA